MKSPNKSIESRLLVLVFSHLLLSASLVIFALSGGVQSTLGIVLLFFALIVATIYLWAQLHKGTVKPLYQIANHLEAIRQEDYRVRSNCRYKDGVFADLQTELNSLSDDLQEHKSRYDQHIFMIHRLIENIATPILILNKADILTHANSAFDMVYSRPWQAVRHCHATDLGLVKGESGWHLEDTARQERWQIRSSEIEERNDVYQMLIFTDIQAVLRETQKRSWQQVIRVLSHEIKNSLSPIRSLAETLKGQQGISARSQSALDIIVERSLYLNDFVTNYSKVFQPIHVNKRSIIAETIFKKVQLLYVSHPITITGSNLHLVADPVLLEQVLINLLKNAVEASPQGGLIDIMISQTLYDTQIAIRDQGTGIANADNIFVPFYTTKEGGQGIGLGLSRQIIEAHGGRLTIANRDGGKGAQALISLPNR